MESFFKPNLKNITLKESQEDPLFLHWVEHGRRFCRKNILIIQKAVQNFYGYIFEGNSNNNIELQLS